ncbi:histone-lysine N-methyltransferase SETMAR-like [Belonocnema kinseyi]|uniref:histone-lysine N-methyltransferase SETMAR-like n=1 Tax=Belonocnema kinseyi TaxID=2817044 RepID=UPI00143CED86|nr:histone-lysine N-methyltransferase SETMAR-like [Belonocnema kinseyi]
MVRANLQNSCHVVMVKIPTHVTSYALHASTQRAKGIEWSLYQYPKRPHWWHERFTNGRESINDDDRSGRPSTSKTDENVDKVQKMLAENRKLTIRELADDLNIAYGSVQDIIVNDLGLRRVAAKLVPKDLNFMQKKDRVDITQDMLSKVEMDPAFIKRIITGDET